ncbi:MAG: alpha/beta fold hydrolase [Clostridia bacterium]
MGETMRSQLFINSEQVGNFVNVLLPVDPETDELEEAQVHYLEAGVGEPLVLIHSLGQSLYTWRNVFAELSENYRVIAIDLLGHGYSSRPDTFTYSMDDTAEVIRRFLDAKGIKSAHMIGFSMGAMYLLRFLSLYPDRVANCMVISPGGVTEQMPKLVHKIMNPLVTVFARNLYSSTDVKKMLLECVVDQEQIDDHMVRQYYEPMSDGLSREGLMYALRNFDIGIVADGLMPIEHEVLVLWGKDDRWHPPSGSIYFQGVLQAGRYYLIRNAGHLLQEEAPVKLLEIIFSYIPPAVPSYHVYEYTQRLLDEQSPDNPK